MANGSSGTLAGLRGGRRVRRHGRPASGPEMDLVRRLAGHYVSTMARRVSRLLCMILVLSAAPIAADQAAAQIRLQTFERGQVAIETAQGARHRFEVELAISGEQHAQGLMYRRSLPDDAGMLFIYDRERPLSMWMKNTLIPLDMLFIAGDGRIVHIVERTVPQSLETIFSALPAAGVLEVNGGTAARLGIRAGDRVRHRVFDGGP